MNMGNEIFNLSIKISSLENYNRVLDAKIQENKNYIDSLTWNIDEHKRHINILNETIDILISYAEFINEHKIFISHYEFLKIYSLSDIDKLKYIREIKINSIL